MCVLSDCIWQISDNYVAYVNRGILEIGETENDRRSSNQRTRNSEIMTDQSTIQKCFYE